MRPLSNGWQHFLRSVSPSMNSMSAKTQVSEFGCWAMDAGPGDAGYTLSKAFDKTAIPPPK